MSDTTDSLEETAVTSPADTNTDASQVEATEARPETVPAEQFKKVQSEARNLRTRLKELEDASKSEADLLRERAMEAARLAPEVERLQAQITTYETALTAEVAAYKEILPKEFVSLLPEGSPVEQLGWCRKARKTAESLNVGGRGLPLSGGRNPSTSPQKESLEEAKARLLSTGEFTRL